MSRGTTTAPPAPPVPTSGDGDQTLRVVIVSQQRSQPPPLGARGSQRLGGRVEHDIGGVQAHFSAVAEALRRDGHEVFHASTFDSPWPWQIIAATVTKVLEPVHKPWAARWHRWWHRTLLDRSVRRVTSTLDEHGPPVVYYAQCPQSARAALGHRGASAAVVLVLHYSERSEAEELYLRQMCTRTSSLYAQVLGFERAILPAVDGLVFVSERSARMVLDMIPEAAGVPRQIIPNFLDAHYADMTDTDLTVVDVTSTSRDVLSIGTLEPRKNHTYLLDIIAATRDSGHPLTATIVGAGTERDALAAKIQALDLGGLVTLAGARRDVRPFLRNHRIYVHVSTAESFGIVLIEAMALAKPIAAVPVGGVPDVLRDGVEGIHLAAADPAGAAAQIISLLDDPQRMVLFSANGRERFMTTFSDERVLPSLVGFFQRSLRTRCEH